MSPARDRSTRRQDRSLEEPVEEQTARVLENIKAILAAGGATMADVVKVSAHLSDLALFERYNKVYATYFPRSQTNPYDRGQSIAGHPGGDRCHCLCRREIIHAYRMNLETPVPVVDIDRMEANIARLQAYLDEHKIANRPHIKTHKIPAIAKMQMDAGAVGITCQKVSEAEVMADAGFDDIFLPYNIIGESKLKRLMATGRADQHQRDGGFSVYSPRACRMPRRQAGLTLTVLVECDTGAHRCGVQISAGSG